MKENNFVVIMAGGIGSRFWPFSRNNYPKQFQDILGVGKSLLRQTFERFAPVCLAENFYVVTNKIYADLVKQQLPELGQHQILLEPYMRNTAPCVAYACYKIREKNPQANIVVAPSDHVILEKEAFIDKIQIALDATAKHNIMLTLGITPSRPDTGYGYIQAKSESTDIHQEVKKVRTFTEKPNRALAEAFLESGDFVWNAGIFIWNVQTIIESIEMHQDTMAEAFEDIKNQFYTDTEEQAVLQAYTQCHSISIDYAIMEKAQNVYVLPCECGWSDLGTWKSLYELAAKDAKNNVVNAQALLYDTKGCIVKMPEDHLVVIQGLSDYIVAQFDKVLLICKKDEEQLIKNYLEDVKKDKKNNNFV